MRLGGRFRVAIFAWSLTLFASPASACPACYGAAGTGADLNLGIVVLLFAAGFAVAVLVRILRKFGSDPP